MSMLFRALVLVAALGAVMAAGNLTTAPAQEKKKKGTKDEIGTTEVYKAKDGWRFKVMNGAGKSVAIGTVGFDTPEEAESIVEYVKNTLAKGKVTVTKDAKK